MAIPESQLETWSHQGSIANSSATYNLIRNVLQAPEVPYAGRQHDVFLQGSYGNDTNIYAESDVDIVIKTDAVFYSDTSQLSASDKQAYDQAFIPATYTLQDFKAEVLGRLTSQYGAAVHAGSKAIAIAASGNRRKADVIVAAQYRRYWTFRGPHVQNYTEGICFFNADGTLIANYPKLHSSNLTTRHQASGGWLKPMVRVLKNLRGRMVSDGNLIAGVAPSYFVEGLLYNVPSQNFGGSYNDCFVAVVDWLQHEADRDNLLCANEQYYLLRDVSHVCWAPNAANQFLGMLTTYWNEW